MIIKTPHHVKYKFFQPFPIHRLYYRCINTEFISFCRQSHRLNNVCVCAMCVMFTMSTQLCGMHLCCIFAVLTWFQNPANCISKKMGQYRIIIIHCVLRLGELHWFIECVKKATRAAKKKICANIIHKVLTTWDRFRMEYSD